MDTEENVITSLDDLSRYVEERLCQQKGWICIQNPPGYANYTYAQAVSTGTRNKVYMHANWVWFRDRCDGGDASS